MGNLRQERTSHLLLQALVAIAGIAAGSADARSIRVDPGKFDPVTGHAMWEQNFGNVLNVAGDTGEVTLPFQFFGASSLFVSDRGVVSFGAPVNNLGDLATAATPYLTPLFLSDITGDLAVTFDWGGQTRNCTPAPGQCGPDGESSAPELQDLVEIDTGGTVFANSAFRVKWVITNDEFDTVTATPADCVLLLALVLASVLAVGPFLAASDAVLLLMATGVPSRV